MDKMFIIGSYGLSKVLIDIFKHDGKDKMSGVTARACSLIDPFCIVHTNSPLGDDSIIDDFSSLTSSIVMPFFGLKITSK